MLVTGGDAHLFETERAAMHDGPEDSDERCTGGQPTG